MFNISYPVIYNRNARAMHVGWAQTSAETREEAEKIVAHLAAQSPEYADEIFLEEIELD